MNRIIVIATRNPAKVSRYRNVLAKYACEVVGLLDLKITGKPEEHGETAEENAEIKAKYYSQETGITVFTEDEALFVDFLPLANQPGVHVRRINGKDEANDEQLLVHWEKIIANVPISKRTGKWHVAYCIAWPDGSLKTFSLDFPIVFFPTSAVKIPGWPMSSLEGPAGFNKPSSELTEEELYLFDCMIDQAIAKIVDVQFSNNGEMP